MLTRRGFLKTAGFGLTGIVTARRFDAGIPKPTSTRTARLYVGTYTQGKSEGIYRCRFDLASGKLAVESVTRGVANPSFLAIDRIRGRLFCVNEVSEYDGKPGGSVSAFSLDPITGDLQFVNTCPSHGADPCYITNDAHGRFVLVANYTGGSLAVLPVHNDGSLGAATHVVQHTGSSVKARQQGPHTHSVLLDSTGRFAYAADLGLDKVMIYGFDNQRGRLLPSTTAWAALKPGAGPRHLAFSPDGSVLYVANELDSTMTMFLIDRTTGDLAHRKTTSTLPSHVQGENFPADIHVAPSGRHVYVSNRGRDSIAVFAVSPDKRDFSFVKDESTGGKWPRNFAIDPAGQFIVVANQKSDMITVFTIHPESGTLSPTGYVADVPSPACLKFL